MEYLKCEFCGFTYESRDGLYRHKKKSHPEQLYSSSTNYLFVCSQKECCSRFHKLSPYLKHLEAIHPELNIVREEHCFSSRKEFLDWKCSTESEGRCQFVQHYASYKQTNGLISTNYFCNRHGSFNSVGAGLREIKAQQSRKTTKSCPASMLVNEGPDGLYKVNYCGTHLDHSLDLEHVDLNLNDKLAIVEKLKDTDLNKELVISNFKLSDPSQSLKRINTIDRKEVDNVMRQFKIFDYERSDDDEFTSLLKTIDSYKKTGSCPFIYSDIDVEPAKSGSSNNRKINRFNVIIMNQTQKTMFLEYGQKGVGVDATHHTTPYKEIKLITIMVIDKNERGFPIANMYTLNETKENLKLLFAKVKENVGQTEFKTHLFMSDLADYYYEAWKEIMGPADFRLVCKFHLIKAWKPQIKRKIKATNQKEKDEIGTRVESLMCQLIDLDSELEFNSKVEDLKNYLGSLAQTELLQYLEMYFRAKSKWAFCLNPCQIMTTNNHVESFHSLFKSKFMKRRSVKRIDRAVSLLLKCLKYFDDRNSSIVQERRQVKVNRSSSHNHNLAIKQSKDTQFEFEKIDHLNYSLINGKITIKITRKQNECELGHGCLPYCHRCRICQHSYSCSCVVYRRHNTICSHIHYLCLKIGDHVVPPAAECLSSMVVDGNMQIDVAYQHQPENIEDSEEQQHQPDSVVVDEEAENSDKTIYEQTIIELNKITSFMIANPDKFTDNHKALANISLKQLQQFCGTNICLKISKRKLDTQQKSYKRNKNM